MNHTYDETIISDLHKDARGFRPSEDWWAMWQDALPAGRQLIWDNLCRELDAELERELAAQSAAERAFEARVVANRALGAGDRATAIRWILQSMDLSANDLRYGGSYVCFELGLNYSMAAEIDPLCAALLDQIPVAA